MSGKPCAQRKVGICPGPESTKCSEGWLRHPIAWLLCPPTPAPHLETAGELGAAFRGPKGSLRVSLVRHIKAV